MDEISRNLRKRPAINYKETRTYTKKPRPPKPPPSPLFLLPNEMRAMVIDKMDAKTRCRFAQCSRKCKFEAQRSKYYLEGLYYFNGDYDFNESGFSTYLCVHVFSDDEIHQFYGFELYSRQRNVTEVIYKSIQIPRDICENIEEIRKDQIMLIGKEKWREYRFGRTEVIIRNFLFRRLENFQKIIKHFLFEKASDLSIKDFKITELKNLQTLKILDDEGVDLLKIGFLNPSQLQKIRSITAKSTNLSFDQIFQYNRKIAYVKCDDFDDEKIKKCLEMWKNGDVSEEIDVISIRTPENKHLDLEYYKKGLEVIKEEGSQCDCMLFKIKNGYAKFNVHPYNFIVFKYDFQK